MEADQTKNPAVDDFGLNPRSTGAELTQKSRLASDWMLMLMLMLIQMLEVERRARLQIEPVACFFFLPN